MNREILFAAPLLLYRQTAEVISISCYSKLESNNLAFNKENITFLFSSCQVNGKCDVHTFIPLTSSPLLTSYQCNHCSGCMVVEIIPFESNFQRDFIFAFVPACSSFYWNHFPFSSFTPQWIVHNQLIVSQSSPSLFSLTVEFSILFRQLRTCSLCKLLTGSFHRSFHWVFIWRPIKVSLRQSSEQTRFLEVW